MADCKRAGWFKVCNDVIDVHQARIGVSAMAVYLTLRRHADNEGVCWPSIKLLCRLTRLSRNTVLGAIRQLETYQMLSITSGKEKGDVNQYKLEQNQSLWRTPPVLQAQW